MKEVKRKAKVGEYIKLTKKDFDFDEIGDILKVDSVRNNVVSVLGKNHKRDTNHPNVEWNYETDEYVVLEDYKEKNMKFDKDNLKVGDKVLLKNKRGDDWNHDGKMDHYIGKIVTIKSLNQGGFTIKEDDGENFPFEFWSFNYEDIERIANDFKRDDLQFADIITLRNGERYVVAVGSMYGENGYYNRDCDTIWDWYNLDLTQNEGEREEDIVKVERSGKVVYERIEEVREMKMEEINKALGFKVKVVE